MKTEVMDTGSSRSHYLESSVLGASCVLNFAVAICSESFSKAVLES